MFKITSSAFHSALIASGEIERYELVHASPPCQAGCALTVGTNAARGWGRTHVQLIPELRALLMRLLDVSSQAEGVRIFIGGESHIVPFEELSVVSAPYEVDGQVVGTLGVIGPTRMAYDRMIQIVDITSRLVSNALSHK